MKRELKGKLRIIAAFLVIFMVVGMLAACGEVGPQGPKDDTGDESNVNIFGKWQVTKEPTCTEPGEETRVCINDSSKTEKREIPAKGHTYENGKCTVCGESLPASKGLKYSLNSDEKSYRVSGIGTCKDTDIVIPAAYNDLPVTSIGDIAFRECSSLKSVVIGNSVTSIGKWAFRECNNLTNIVIGDSVTSIGDEAFYGCSSLTSAVIGNSVTSIGNDAFYKCGSLTSIVIPDSVTSIGWHAFSRCISLTSIVIPDSVTSISNNAFYGCSSLTSVVIPNSVTSIGDGAFRECSSLTSAVIGNSVTSISNYAFYGCSSLTSVVIPNSVMSIGDCAFRECSSLTSAVIGNSVTSIGDYAFYGCYSLTSVVIGNSVMSIGDCAFLECNGGPYVIENKSNITMTIGRGYYGGIVYYAKMIINKDGSITYKQEGNNYHLTDDKFLFSEKDGVYTLIAYTGGKETVTLPTNIFGNSYEISNMRGVVNVIIPDSMTRIGDEAFQRCSSLTSVVIPDSVTSIDDRAFFCCISLTSVVIPNSVTSISNYAFYGCSSLTSVVIPDSVTRIGNYAFQRCSSLTSVVIPDSVTRIGNYAFRECSSLTSVVIGHSVTSIGYYVFDECSSLESITVSSGNKKYHSAGNCLIDTANKTLILGCKNSIIPTDGSVTSISNYAFDECSSLTSVVIPNSVTSIGWGAFYECRGLTSICYNGTKAQWQNISKGYDWNYNTGKYTITCTDGTLSK